MLTKQQKARAYKRQEYRGKLLTQQLLFASVYGVTTHVEAFDRAGRYQLMRAEDALCVSKAVVKWNLTCLCIMRDMWGKDEWRAMTLALDEPVRQSSIHKALSQAHYRWAFSEINPKYILTLAWVATAGPEPGPEVIGSILNQLKALDNLLPVSKNEDGDGWLLNFKSHPGEVISELGDS